MTNPCTLSVYRDPTLGETVKTTSLAAAVMAVKDAGGGLIHCPNGANGAMPDLAGVLLEIDGPNIPGSQGGEPNGTNFFAQKIFRSQEDAAHMSAAYSVVHVEGRPKGTGASGPDNADFGLTISLLKQGFTGECASGELDGMNIIVRNSGADADTTCILGNVAHYGTGFTAFFESMTSLIHGGAVTKQIDLQAGVIDSRTGYEYGLVVQAFAGALSVGLLIQNAGGTWTDFAQFVHEGVPAFRVDGVGRVRLRDAWAASNPNEIVMGVGNGTFYLQNNGAAQTILTIDQAGNMVLAGSLTVSSLTVGGETWP